jgi:hypothetical protein
VVSSWTDFGLARRPSKLTQGVITFALRSITIKSNLVVSPMTITLGAFVSVLVFTGGSIGSNEYGARRPSRLVRIVGSLHWGMLS